MGLGSAPLGTSPLGASGSAFDAVRADILAGITSAQSEILGWNNEVRDKESITSVVRTSDTVVTITLSAAAAYDITAQETITVTVPASAVTGGLAIVGSPVFTVDTVAGSSFQVAWARNANQIIQVGI